MGGVCSGYGGNMGERRSLKRFLVGKPEGMSPLGKSRRGWKDNIKMNLQEVGWECMVWIELA